MPMAAALSTTHGLLPPHPAPTAIAITYNASVNLTLVYGFLIALPTVVLAGPVLSRFFKHITQGPPTSLFSGKLLPENELPGLGVSIFISLLPVLLMMTGALANVVLPAGSSFLIVFKFISDTNIALLTAVLAGLYFLGYRQGRKMEEQMESLSSGVSSIAMILLIIASGGGFKQVLVDSGVGNAIEGIAADLPLSPLVLVWTVAALLRLALGSATVAAITAAGMVQPVIVNSGIAPELMVLATTAGSLMFSHVNDIGFWMFKEYFNLTIKQTFSSWTVMESIVSVMGLLGTLLLHTLL
jgi:gluconate transporter